MESSDLLREQLSVEITEIRKSLQADGVDLEALELDDGIAKFRLVVGSETCQECILPKHMVALRRVKERLRHKKHVILGCIRKPGLRFRKPCGDQ